MEIVKLVSGKSAALALFLKDLRERGDHAFFAPHATDEHSICEMISAVESDLFYVAMEREQVLAYGLLRGWDEGFAIPSLGVAVHPDARGTGLGKLMMHFLHLAAARRGAAKVRLRVQMGNARAISLYEALGYVFEDNRDGSEYRVAFKTLKPQHVA